MICEVCGKYEAILDARLVQKKGGEVTLTVAAAVCLACASSLMDEAADMARAAKAGPEGGRP